ncbi:molybdenum ABC transporter, periplasmic molybdenum-binding protein [Janthinobacterium sp. Marseille]|nr:molybdenum ABC transporter, periplasmic molybdenum-binding protein [Janthinobacterium sp. Marseille]
MLGTMFVFCPQTMSFPATRLVSAAAQSYRLLAAGSLHAVMDEMIRAYQQQGGAAFDAQYGPSGKLRQEIENGAQVDVFASASVGHTEALAQQKLLGPSTLFTHNDLCVLARPTLDLRTDNLLTMLADPALRIATSTPASDPMGDYTWQFFRNADRRIPGFYEVMNAQAVKLSGTHIPAADERLPYITAFEEDRADAYIMYCTNAVVTRKVLPQLKVVAIPDDLNVRSAYGIAAHTESEQGKRFVQFVLAAAGQAILKKHGFGSC